MEFAFFNKKLIKFFVTSTFSTFDSGVWIFNKRLIKFFVTSTFLRSIVMFGFFNKRMINFFVTSIERRKNEEKVA